MAVNADFLVAAVDLAEVFLDKDTGEPLSGGTVSFFRDVDRVTPKLVYTIQNNNPALPPNYTYIPLPNPITLSASGQFEDNNGNNIPVYYYPVTGPNNTLDLYYIVVTSAAGVQQFVRQGWPPNESAVLPPPAGTTNSISNQLTNSQFIDVNFSLANILVGTTVGYTFNYAGAATDTINVAPGWNLVIVHSGNGQIEIGRTPVQGSSAFQNNPPYTFYVNPGANITNLSLVQTLQNNPDVFSPQPLGVNGYVSASFLLRPNTTASMSYQPNGQPPQLILNSTTNTTGAYAQYNQTTQLQPATNPSTGDTGTVSIIVNLSTTQVSELSNIQVVPLNANIGGIPYDQRTANRERDFEFNVYKQPLFNKPINSYLIGWDFPLNPTQVSGNGTIGAQATGGAAGSFQAWDQTVIFQSVTNGVTLTRSALGNGAMRVTANAAAVQFAVIQYLPQAIAREILQNSLSSQFTGLTNIVAGLNATTTLWWTTGALPSTAANNSIVTALDANGFPTVAAGWNQVPRGNLGNAQFTVGTSATLDFNDYGFSGWNMNGALGVNTATFFAIVVGFGTFSNIAVVPDTVDIGSISLVPGSIPTRPAPQKAEQVILDCNQFYWKSFPIGTAPAGGLNNTLGVISYYTRTAGAGANGQNCFFPVPMNTIPVMTGYNPGTNNNANWWNINTVADSAASAFVSVGTRGFTAQNPQGAGDNAFNQLALHATADSRLGL